MENNQKLDSTLNLAIDIPVEEREQSRELGTGYDAREKTWRVIVKYTGELEAVEEAVTGSQAIPLFNQYGIIRVPEGSVDQLAALPQIQYVEKPKQLYFSLDVGRSVSCITSVQGSGGSQAGMAGQRTGLTGQGILVGIVDSGERVIIMSS